MSDLIWRNLIEAEHPVTLGISAGRNKKYKHPHSATLSEIRTVRNDAQIYVTNICSDCIYGFNAEKEYHSWYENAIHDHSTYKTTERNMLKVNDTIEHIISLTNGLLPSQSKTDSSSAGLLAYILTVPSNPANDITVRMALSNQISKHSCFYTEHSEPYCAKCKVTDNN